MIARMHDSCQIRYSLSAVVQVEWKALFPMSVDKYMVGCAKQEFNLYTKILDIPGERPERR